MGKKIAVLFDLDGTLVDTEPYWLKALTQISADHGYHWSLKDSEEVVGANLSTTVQVLRQRAGISKSLEDVRAELIAGVNACYQEDGVPWLEGAYEILVALGNADIPNAVVSNSPKLLVEQVVKLAPAGSLSLMVPGDTPQLVGKPAPDPYLYAAEKLGVEIQNCVIFEDSVTGITAATRSGAKAVLLGKTTKLENLDSDVQEILTNPQRSRFSLGLQEWDLLKIQDFLQ